MPPRPRHVRQGPWWTTLYTALEAEIDDLGRVYAVVKRTLRDDPERGERMPILGQWAYVTQGWGPRTPALVFRYEFDADTITFTGVYKADPSYEPPEIWDLNP